MNNSSRLLAGRYQVGELIGRGGMAEVHIGHDTRLGRTVAIKILRSDLARDPSFQARFRREAQAAAALNHPAIVAVYDTGEDVVTDANGVTHHVPFIVMEYVEGHTVRDILRDGTAVPIEEAVEITAGVLSALEYSHHAGIVHRDIKPANVMLTPTGAVKVMDFGIARALADSAATMTQTQAVVGTAQYLSPEQARGEPVDARSDIYSTGCLLYELLTGRPPFVGDSPVSVAYQHVREEAPPPSTYAADVPEALDRITVQALAKDREQRYSSAAEFRADLEAAMRGAPVSAPAIGTVGGAAMAGPPTAATQVIDANDGTQVLPTPGAPTAAWSPLDVEGAAAGDDTGEYQPEDDKRRKRLIWILVAVALAAVAAIVAMLLLSGDDEPPPPETIAVPDVRGLPEADARAAIEGAGLVWAREQRPDDEIEEGHAIGSDPEAGEEVELESVVTVFISSGPDQVTVPDVRGQTQEQARETLEEAGLRIARTDLDHDPDVEQNRATRTDPPADETVDRNTEVVLYVSSGQVELPDLVGKTLEEAEDILNELRLNFTTREVESEERPGTVIRQDRSPGLVAQGTRITLEVAIPIPEPEPDPDPEPEPDPEPTDEETPPDDGEGPPEGEGPPPDGDG